MSKITEEIKEKLDIAAIIGSYIKLEKAGINWKARCPFHNEKTPSFFISTARQSYYCFGCHEKGDIFTFVEKFEGVDFKGALFALAEKAGVNVSAYSSKEDSREERDSLHLALEEAAKFFEANLKNSPKAKEYLEKRGVNEESIKKWRIGFAEDAWRHLYDTLQDRGFKREILLEAGLIKKAIEDSSAGLTNSPQVSSGQGKYYDTFRNRIIFPICDSAGRVIAFSGRALNPDEKTPKYLNSPETKVFYKSEALHGLHLAKLSMRKSDYCILVEGQMDLVMAHQAGTPNTVASSGTSLTLLHLQKIKKLTNRVVIAYDADSAGEEAAYKAGKMALSLNMEVKVAKLPEGEDPGSLAQKSPDQWKEAIRSSEHLIDREIEKAILPKDTRAQNKQMNERVMPLIALLDSEIGKSQYLKKIAIRLRVDELAVKNDFQKVEDREKEKTKTETDRGGKIETKSVEIQKNNLERLILGIIFLEETKNQKTVEDNAIFQKYEMIVGKETASQNYKEAQVDQESLMFEAESHLKAGETFEALSQEILNRIEIKLLKEELQRQTRILDDTGKNEEEEKRVTERIKEIQQKIKKLTENTN